MSAPGLNENHARRLRVAMHQVDAAVARMLDLLEQTSQRTRLTVVHASLNPAQAEETRFLLQHLQKQAVELAVRLKLPHHQRDLRRVLLAETSQIWTTLEDCRPKKMKGMGQVSAEAADQLEKEIQAMLHVVQKMLSMLNTKDPDSSQAFR